MDIYNTPSNTIKNYTKPIILTALEVEDGKKAQKRKPQSLIMFFLVCIMELLTIFLSILLILVQNENKKWVYLTFIVMTMVRVFIFFINTYIMVGCRRKTFALYFLMDNTFLVMIGSDITYAFLNYSSSVDYVIGAIVCYPILLFFLVGNCRVMMIYSNWRRWQVICYKFVKIIGSTYFLVYGCYLILWAHVQNYELLLLWIFTTCGFWAEMCFLINTMDQSDQLQTKYILADQD